MKTYAAAAAAISLCIGVSPSFGSAQGSTSSARACVSSVCDEMSSANITSSASKAGTSASDFANAHTGLRVVNPFPGRSDAVQAGTSGIGVSATPGTNVTADARWSDVWRCDVLSSPCIVDKPQFGMFTWVLHLHGVVDPILVAPVSADHEHSVLSLSLSYGDQNSGYAFTFSVCYDSGPCGVTSAFGATLATPNGTQDLTPNIVFGTNAQGLPTVDLDVSLGTSFCFGITPGNACTWGDSFRASADLENTGTATHFMDFSGTFDAAIVSLDPLDNWVSDGGRTAPTTGAAPSTATGQYLPPLNQSTDVANPAINNIKNGRVIPVKVQLDQSNVPITDQNAPGPITILVSGPVACSNAPPSDVGTYADAGQSNAGSNQYRFDPTSQTWIYNLDTRALGLSIGMCYRIGTAVNGASISNAFVVIRPTK